jgi:subtilisin family serine protease
VTLDFKNGRRDVLRALLLFLLWCAAPDRSDVAARGQSVGEVERQVIGPSDNWALDRIDQTGRSLDGAYRYRERGIGVAIYVIDTGVRQTHVDFLDDHGSSRVTYVGDFCTGRARTASAQVDKADGFDGHGTHVASYAAGRRSGVAKAASVYSLRASWHGRRDDADYLVHGGPACGDDGNRHTNDEAVRLAVLWIIGHGLKPAVVNISFGGGSERTQAAILEAMHAGFVFTLSGGSGGAVQSHWGNAVPITALVVGGTDRADRPLGTGYGPLLALYAPAQGLMGAGKGSDTDFSVPEQDGCSRNCRGGDSFAAPLVAGAAALFLETHPSASPAEVKTAIVQGSTAGVVDTGTPDRLLRVH